MKNLNSWIWTVIGVLWLLPLISIKALEGTFTNWISALGVLVIGVLGLTSK